MANTVTLQNNKRSRWFFDIMGEVPKDAPKGTKPKIEQTIVLGDREAAVDKGEKPPRVDLDMKTWEKLKAQHGETLRTLCGPERGEISIFGATL